MFINFQIQGNSYEQIQNVLDELNAWRICYEDWRTDIDGRNSDSWNEYFNSNKYDVLATAISLTTKKRLANICDRNDLFVINPVILIPTILGIKDNIFILSNREIVENKSDLVWLNKDSNISNTLSYKSKKRSNRVALNYQEVIKLIPVINIYSFKSNTTFPTNNTIPLNNKKFSDVHFIL